MGLLAVSLAFTLRTGGERSMVVTLIPLAFLQGMSIG